VHKNSNIYLGEESNTAANWLMPLMYRGILTVFTAQEYSPPTEQTVMISFTVTSKFTM
jgi:hypothetical protein